MISLESHTRDWIEKVSKSSTSKDPILIEKMIMALILVEHLRLRGMEFIFKGGTSLILALGKPQRFSIDVDVVTPPDQDLAKYFQFVIDRGVFSRCEEDVRRGDLPKQHYKFFFKSIIQPKESHILLDILYEENPYPQLREIEIKSSLIMTDGDISKVLCPALECLLGDKLTAFAPHTTGVQYGKGKDLEIAKQLLDVATLYDASESIKLINATHESIARKELQYRQLNDLTPQDVLLDTFTTSCLIGTHGHAGVVSEYKELVDGISKLRGYIYSGNFSPDSAIVCASKAAILSVLMMKDMDRIIRYEKGLDMSTWTILNPEYSKLNKLKKTNPEAFFYFFKALEVMR